MVHLQRDYMPRVVSSLINGIPFTHPFTLSALLLSIVPFAFVTSVTQRKRVSGFKDDSFSCFFLIYHVLLLKGQSKNSKIYSQNAQYSDFRLYQTNFSYVCHMSQF